MVFYSMYSHVFQLAEAITAGAAEIRDIEVALFQVPELVPPEALEQAEATTLSGADGSRQPSENELAIAGYQGRHVAEVARQLKLGRAPREQR